jgi:hypothetical protein
LRVTDPPLVERTLDGLAQLRVVLATRGRYAVICGCVGLRRVAGYSGFLLCATMRGRILRFESRWGRKFCRCLLWLALDQGLVKKRERGGGGAPGSVRQSTKRSISA